MRVLCVFILLINFVDRGLTTDQFISENKVEHILEERIEEDERNSVPIDSESTFLIDNTSFDVFDDMPCQ